MSDGAPIFAIVFVVLVVNLGVVAGSPTVGNCPVFPADDELNRAIDGDAVDPMSPCIVSTISSWGANLRLDLGYNVADGYGIPYTITNTTALLPITYGTDGADYWSESDWFDSNGNLIHADNVTSEPVGTAFWPVPQDCAIEGWGGNTSTDPTGGDRHICVVNTQSCLLIESWNSVRLANGFQISNSAVFNLSQKLPQRPDTWTSADAAGLPIYPLLLKYGEIAAGSIDHAIRFTALRAQAAFVHPGSHFGPYHNANYPVYGSRFRLKASYNISGYSSDGQVFLRALKKYGLIFADQGSTVFITGTTDPGFVNLIDEINSQKRIAFSNFEMVLSPFEIIRDYNPGTVTCSKSIAPSFPIFEIVGMVVAFMCLLTVL